MAQAARLNLRMQKELKLLLSDPPPRAAFPSLSSDSSSSAISLSSIDAQIEGPEGSVYEKGVFKLKVQIPERYPFQPPIVTFVTPIYHPNIDTGGRICLDILNLPPKGAWQPSLNISTVLTSIGLLLTEPNPDDGLMQEASKEYKYNRQVFDQKARSMTEKYAGVVGASKIKNVAQSSQSLPNPSIHSAEAKGSDTSMALVQDHFVSHKRLCGVTRKLSLESSESHQKTNDAKVMNEVPTSHLYDRQSKVMGLEQESNATISEHNKAHKDLEGTRKKLSLQKKNDGAMSNVMPTSSCSQPQILLMDTSKSRPLAQPGSSSQPNPNMDKDDQPTSNCTGTRLKSDSQKSLASRQGIGEDDRKQSFALQETPVQFSYAGSHQTPPLAQTISCDNEREPRKDVTDGHGSSFSRIKQKKLGLSGRRLSREQIGWNHCPQKDNKENVPPKSSLPLSHIQRNPKSPSAGPKNGGFYNSVETCTNSSHNLSGTEQRKNPSSLVECNDMKMVELQLKLQSEYLSGPRSLQDNNSCNDKKELPKDDDEEASLSADAVVVLDSEDSEEEDQTTRSKLSLARRRLPGKRKFNT